MSEECDQCVSLSAQDGYLGKASVWVRQGMTGIVDNLASTADVLNNCDGIVGMEPDYPICLHQPFVRLCKQLHWTWNNISEMRKALHRNIENHEKESGHKVVG